MTYEGHRINCDNYPWYARVFNRPHHEIENDPRVWDLAASLIDSESRGQDINNSDFVVMEAVCQIVHAHTMASLLVGSSSLAVPRVGSILRPLGRI